MTAPRWSDAELAHLQADYENSRHADDHSDVVAAIRGLRAVVARHQPKFIYNLTEPVCAGCGEWFPCAETRALNLEV